MNNRKYLIIRLIIIVAIILPMYFFIPKITASNNSRGTNSGNMELQVDQENAIIVGKDQEIGNQIIFSWESSRNDDCIDTFIVIKEGLWGDILKSYIIDKSVSKGSGIFTTEEYIEGDYLFYFHNENSMHSVNISYEFTNTKYSENNDLQFNQEDEEGDRLDLNNLTDSSKINFAIESGSLRCDFNVNAEIHIPKKTLDFFTSTDIIAPGETVDIEIAITKAQASITIPVPKYGNIPLEFDTPLGRKSVPITGVPGATLNADINGKLRAEIIVDGPGSISENSLEWQSSETKSIRLETTDEAKIGDEIKILLKFEYIVSIGVSTEVILLGSDTLYEKDVGSISGFPDIGMKLNVEERSMLEKMMFSMGDVCGFPIFLLVFVFSIIVILKITFSIRRKVKSHQKKVDSIDRQRTQYRQKSPSRTPPYQPQRKPSREQSKTHRLSQQSNRSQRPKKYRNPGYASTQNQEHRIHSRKPTMRNKFQQEYITHSDKQPFHPKRQGIRMRDNYQNEYNQDRRYEEKGDTSWKKYDEGYMDRSKDKWGNKEDDWEYEGIEDRDRGKYDKDYEDEWDDEDDDWEYEGNGDRDKEEYDEDYEDKWGDEDDDWEYEGNGDRDREKYDEDYGDEWNDEDDDWEHEGNGGRDRGKYDENYEDEWDDEDDDWE